MGDPGRAIDRNWDLSPGLARSGRAASPLSTSDPEQLILENLVFMDHRVEESGFRGGEVLDEQGKLPV